MSFRSNRDAKNQARNSKAGKAILEATTLATMEFLEERQLLSAYVVHTGPTLNANDLPTGPMPGQTFWVNGEGTANAWQYASAITPYTVNDAVLNVAPFCTNYTACCEGSGGTIGINLLTNGLTQNQVGNLPSKGAVAATGDGGNSDPSNNENVLSNNNTANWFAEYNLGAAPGVTPSSTGYDISEIDVISGHQDSRIGMQVDIQVEYVGSTDWISLSNGADFTFTADTTGTTLNRGSAQMAIQNLGAGPIASGVQRVKFIAVNDQTWFRELVVTATASAGVSAAAPAPINVSGVIDPNNPGNVDVYFTDPTGSTNPVYYQVRRATVTNGVVGSYTTIGVVPGITAGSTTSYVDTTTAANTTYVYEVAAYSPYNGGTFSVSSPSAPLTTAGAVAEAHYYNMAFWEGPVVVAQGVPLVNYVWSNGSPATGIRTTSNGAVFTGKITTNQAGDYIFVSNTDDDGYLYVDGALVSADPGSHGQRNAGFLFDANQNTYGTIHPISLAANTSYDFMLLEHNSGGGGAAHLEWITPTMLSSGGQTILPVVVPASNLSPVSDAPGTQPPNTSSATGVSNLQVVTTNANFVNFTFTAQNNSVVNYILQRAIAGTTNWVTVDQIDPGGDAYTTAANSGITLPGTSGPYGNITTPNVITSVGAASLTIQDADPLAGQTYIYRVGAVNYDGTVYSPTVTPVLGTAADVASPPTGSVTLTTTANTGSPIPAGTYYVEYTWLNSAYGQTGGSAEQTVVLTAPGYINVTAPAAPTGPAVSSASIYLSSASGKEQLVGSTTPGGSLTVTSLPYTSAAAVPTTDAAGLTAGTYYVKYTLLGNGGTGESAPSPETSIVLSSTQDLTVAIPSSAGASQARVYVGKSSGGEVLVGTAATGGTLTVNSIPSANTISPPMALVNTIGTFTAATSSVAIPAQPVYEYTVQGTEDHIYNQELIGRYPNTSSYNDEYAVAENGLATDYVPITQTESFPSSRDGAVDFDYSLYNPTILNSSSDVPPQSPAPNPFPDIFRIHTESFTQVFTGKLLISVTGEYTLISNSDDDGFLWLNGTLVSADPNGHGQQDASASRSGDTLTPVYLVAGQSYDLVFEAQQRGGSAGAHLEWIEPVLSNSQGGTGNIVSATNSGPYGATVYLPNYSSTASGYYDNYTIFLTGGTGAGQQGTITSYYYNTSLQEGVASVAVTTNGTNSLFTTLPNSSTTYSIAYDGMVPIAYAGNTTATGDYGGMMEHMDPPDQGTWNSTIAGAGVTNNTLSSAAQNVAITQVSPTSGVTLTWQDQSNSTLWYEIQRSTDGTNYTTVGTAPFDIGTTFTDASATNAYNNPNVTYYYRVRGDNYDGTGVFSNITNTNSITIAPPSFASAVQGAPGTAGFTFSNGSVDGGGLLIRYAPVNSGSTGTFVTATPTPLPYNTYDYQVTGLTPTQQYVFEIANATSQNLSSVVWSAPLAFTPSGGINEAFGTPGTGVGGFTSAGDLQINGNASLTGSTGIPAAPQPTTGFSVAGNTPDLSNPGSNAPTFAVSADVPAPSVAGTAVSNPNNQDLVNARTYYLEYTFTTASGGETVASPQTAVTNIEYQSNLSGGINITYQVPSTFPAGATNANVYLGYSIGTTTAQSQEYLAGTVGAGKTLVITALPTSTQIPPTSNLTGVPAGTYYVEYTYTNGSSQETAASSEFTVVANSGVVNDITVTLPSLPNNGQGQIATGANVYISNSSGTEVLAGSTSGNPPTLTIRSLPSSTAKAAPTVNSTGLPLGTYYAEYTWQNNEANVNSTNNETPPSPVQTIVISSANQDLGLKTPAAPAGSTNANIYIGYQAPNPTAAATLTAGTSGSLTAGTYYVQYEWLGVNSSATLPSTEQTVVTSGATNGSIAVVAPAIPAGVLGYDVFVGSASGAEKLAGSVTGSAGTTQTYTIKSLPATSAASVNSTNTTGQYMVEAATVGGNTVTYFKTVPTSGNAPPIAAKPTNTIAISGVADTVTNPTAPLSLNTSTDFNNAGVNAGTYFLDYTWTANGGQTLVSPEATVVATSNNTDILAGVPAAPSGAGNADIYIGTVSGGEHYVGQAAGGSTMTITALPASTAATPPTTATTALPAGTYYVEYTLTSNAGETAGSPEASIVLTNVSNDLIITGAPIPYGASGERVYVGTASGYEHYVNTISAGSTLVVKSLPAVASSKLVPTQSTQQVVYQTPANALQLTPDQNGQDGTAFNLGENINGFTTSFDYEFSGREAADGITFTIQPTSRTALGGGGGSFGYEGSTFPHSIAITFGLYNAAQTGLAVNGSGPSPNNDVTQINGTPTNISFDNNPGDIYNVTLTYNPTTKILSETLTDLTLKARNITAVYSTNYTIDIVATIGMPAAFVGFTGASGGGAAEKDVLNWTFTGGYVAPTFTDVINGTTGVDNITLTHDASNPWIDWTMGTASGQMLISDTAGLTINGAGSNDVITLNYANGNPLPNIVHLNGTFTVNGLQTPTGLSSPLQGTTLDIEKSTVYVNYGSPGNDPLTLVRSYLAAGYNGGTWNGTSANGVIISSAAAANTAGTTGIEYIDSADGTGFNTTANSIELAYGLYGDANNSGTVDVKDLGQLLASYNQPATGLGFDSATGDFNYDNSVNVKDLGLFLANYNHSLS